MLIKMHNFLKIQLTHKAIEEECKQRAKNTW